MAAESRSRKAITLRDISLDTGYSITAVSHALNDRSDISAQAKVTIHESAARLGYIGNHAAASLQSGRSRIIAVIVGDTSNPFFAFMTRIIENELRARGYSSFFMNTSENEEIERQCLLLAARQNVDGMLWCPFSRRRTTCAFWKAPIFPLSLSADISGIIPPITSTATIIRRAALWRST